MPKITIDLSGIAGLAPRYYGDKPFNAANAELRYFGKEGQMADGIYNPISLLGFMSPASDTLTAVTGVTSYLITTKLAMPQNIARGSSPHYWFCDEAESTDDGQILEITSSTDTTLANVHTIPARSSGTQHYHIEDAISYTLNGLTEWFFLYANNADTATFDDIIRQKTYVFNGDTDNAYASGFDGDTIPLWNRERYKFVHASNNSLYIIDGAAVHRIDGQKSGGANGVATANVLVFVGSNVSTIQHLTRIQDVIDTRDRMWFGLHVKALYKSKSNDVTAKIFQQEVGVYVWDRLSTVASMQDFIWIPGVKELKAMCIFQGNPACWTVSYDNYTEFRVFNGVEFVVVQRMGKSAYPTFRNHSYEAVGDLIYWLGNDGTVYVYGKFEPGLTNALYKIGDMTGHIGGGETWSRGGVLAMLGDTESVASGRNPSSLAFYVSFESTANNYMKRFYPHGYDPADTDRKAYTGETKTLVQLMPKLSNIQGLTLHFPSVGSGGSTALLDIKIYKNMSSTADATITLTQNDAQRGWKWIPYSPRNVNALQIGLTWKAENLANNITPYVAVVDYEPTGKKS